MAILRPLARETEAEMAADKNPKNGKGKSVRKKVFDGILNYITENALAPGSKLPSEGEMAEILNVSRTSLREGIRMLEGAGFITTRHGNGMYVTEYDGSRLMDYIQYSIEFENNSLAELYDIRKTLEIHYIREVAETITDEQLRTLRDIVERMDENDLLNYHWLDMEFHLTLYEHLSNKLVTRIIQLYWDVMLGRWLPGRTHDMPGTMAGNHEMIIRALESRDPRFAEAAMRVHMFDSHIV